MNPDPRAQATISFPSLPPSRFRPAPIGMRSFGICESDLAIDFSERSPAALITRILEQCTIDPEHSLPEDFFLTLSVGKRLECLLTLAAGEERRPFNFPFHCAGCGQKLEMELTLDEIAEMQRDADLIETVAVRVGGRCIACRKPSGQDLERWEGRVFSDEAEAARAMIDLLAATPVEWSNSDVDELDRIDDAMDEADPLVNFRCHAACGECGEPNECLIDLCDTALGMLSRLQKLLIVMVHKLASHYHWSEKEVFAIPHWRRTEYLDLIAAGR